MVKILGHVVEKRANMPSGFAAGLFSLSLTSALQLPTRGSARAEAALLSTLGADGQATPATLSAFTALERAAPAPLYLLDDAEAARALDGRWTLLATIAATVGAELSATSSSGVVNASGLVIEVAPSQLPVQQIDLAAARIANELKLSLPGPLGSFYVRVSGGFEGAGRRATVTFDQLQLFSSEGRLLASATSLW